MWARRIALALGGSGALCAGVVGSVVAWAAATAEQRFAYPDTPYPALSASEDPGAVERGRYLVHGPAHCVQCHSSSDREHPETVVGAPLRGGLAFDMSPLAVLYARNLTPDPTHGIGRRSDAELARAMRAGVLPEGNLSIFMRYSGAHLSDSDIRDVLAYLRSLPPDPNEVPPQSFTLLGKVIVKLAFPIMEPRSEPAPAGVAPAEEPSLERGAYLADHVMLCTACHTAFDPSTFQLVGPKGGGGLAEVSHGSDTDMEFCPPNLTSHPTGVTGKLDEDAFVARMRAGRAHRTSIMPWESFAATTEADLRSVYRYLRTLPPVDQDTGPPYRPVGWTPGR